MKAITLHQPWASMIAWGWKTIETRTHRRFRGLCGSRIAIHAGATWDAEARNIARPYLSLAQREMLDRKPAALPRKAIVATAVVCAVRAMQWADRLTALCPVEMGRVSYILRRIRRVDPPIACPGHQGIWTIPEDAARQLAERGLGG